MTSKDVVLLRGVIPEDDAEPDVVEVILVNNDLAAEGGGASFSCTTALARIVMSNGNNGNPNLLAHEIGHVLGGLHPGDSQEEGFWVPEVGTVLDPSRSSHVPNPERNPASSRRQVRCAALTSTGEECCISA